MISSAPALVHHGKSFVIESPDAPSIVKVVLVRPMAVTHQTDSEQKVLEMPYIHDHANPSRLTLTAPYRGHPHSLALQGYYMMFAINNNGVPSIAKWIYLHRSSHFAHFRANFQNTPEQVSSGDDRGTCRSQND